MLDLISIGDTTLDTFLELENASVFCDLNKNNCQLCINYADKIPVKSVNQTVGGNAANFAVGASRLGLKTGLFTILGDDAIGKQAKRLLLYEKIDPRLISIDKGKKTNNSTILNLRGERTILIFHEKRNYCPVQELPKAKFCYITSMKDGWECMLDKKNLTQWIDKNNVFVGYNPGTFQIRAGIKNSKPLLKKTKVLFVNKKEAQIWLKTEEDDFEVLLKKLQQNGPEIVVITDSKNGSFAIKKSKVYFQPIFSNKLVEATGAGDAYASGFISALFYGKKIEEAMIWGTKNAGSVIEKIGPQRGLLKRDKIKEVI